MNRLANSTRPPNRNRFPVLAGLAGLLLWGAECAVAAGTATTVEAMSSYAKWSPIELIFHGPRMKARGNSNPFDIHFDVIFRGPDGRTVTVPGFYDGNGTGGENGNVWKVRFSADKVGRWTYKTRSDHQQLDGSRGAFMVVSIDPDARGFWKWGRLTAVGTAENGIRYLKFQDGPYWLKAGCDDPENFLGRYRHFNTPAKRKTAVEYLSQRGINSLYLLTHNIDGDDNDVWPWLGKTPSEAKKFARRGNVRFHIGKLHQWRKLFEYMTAKGVVPYLILEDDSAFRHYDHIRYYREMIARFGDLPALLFNIGEESNENYSLAEGLKLAAQFRHIDPYRHPLGIHNVNHPRNAYVESLFIDFTSIQTGHPGTRTGLRFALEHNALALRWIQHCRNRKTRVLMIGFDEGRPEEDRRAWWAAYLGGGVWEAHIRKPYDQPLKTRDNVWSQLGGARAFLESLPFWQMQPRNDLVVEGQAFCLASPPEVYALYLPHGGPITVRLASGTRYHVEWWNPAQGKEGRFRNRTLIAGGMCRLTPPEKGDWAVRLLKQRAR